MKEFLYIFLGLIAGISSGLFGIGGGIILVPALVYLASLSQHEAQGTSLAILLLPLGFLAVWRYYQNGHINFYVAAFLCIGFILGGLLGANIAESLSNEALRKTFGVFLLVVAINMVFFK